MSKSFLLCQSVAHYGVAPTSSTTLIWKPRRVIFHVTELPQFAHPQVVGPHLEEPASLQNSVFRNLWAHKLQDSVFRKLRACKLRSGEHAKLLQRDDNKVVGMYSNNTQRGR